MVCSILTDTIDLHVKKAVLTLQATVQRAAHQTAVRVRVKNRVWGMVTIRVRAKKSVGMRFRTGIRVTVGLMVRVGLVAGLVLRG